MKYKVLLLTSGVGSRLGNITQYTNKALIRIGKKPAICHIIDYYPKDVEFVITLGYFGKQVKEFLELVYPNRKFNFVWFHFDDLYIVVLFYAYTTCSILLILLKYK